MKMTWKKVWFGAYQCGPYIIEKTSNPDAVRQWYVRGGSSEFDEALRMMKIRVLGEVLFREYEGGDGCAWCEAGRHTDWGDDGGVIFFENDKGAVRRVESPDGQLILCTPSTLVQATLELAEWRALPGDEE